MAADLPEPRRGGLLEPGSEPGYAVAGDAAVLAALVAAEQAWLEVLAEAGAAPSDLPQQLAAALRSAPHLASPAPLASLAGRVADGGNPVIPLVEDLRSLLGAGGRFVHRGLTSQDVLDTALVLVARDALDEIATALGQVGDALAALAEDHRDTVMVGRTLTQHAVPITFGLKAAQWLMAVTEVLGEVEGVRGGLPVQCGGAAGTLAASELLTEGDGLALGRSWAHKLGLQWPTVPWHTRRRPITGIGDVLAAVVSTLAHVGTDIATLSRPEIGELSEGAAPGRGRSSTMPHKRNPVGAVLLRAAGIQAGPLAGVLHQCAALAVDERGDGAWHAEWPTLQRLLVLATSSAVQAVTVVDGLVVHTDVMSGRVEAVRDELLSERRQLSGAGSDETTTTDTVEQLRATDYLGAASALTDSAVQGWRARGHR